MAIRFDDATRSLVLSVHDLVEEGAPSGHLVLDVAWRRSRRAEAGIKVHAEWQAERTEESEAYTAEFTIKRTLAVEGWTALLWGRADGIERHEDHTLVEEVKSTPLDAKRLFQTSPSDWPAWLAQLEVYLWMLADAGHPSPIGRLILVSLADGSRHVVGVPLQRERVYKTLVERIGRLCRARDRRIAWMERRKADRVPHPHGQWRAGQQLIVDRITEGLAQGKTVLVQAPTGLGKTDAALFAAIQHALRADRQVFWATARTTQQVGAVRALRRLHEQGLPIRSVTLSAKEKVCLNDIVSCRPDVCRFAESYYDRLHDSGLPQGLSERDRHIDAPLLRSVGSDLRLCPFELALDVSPEVDVIIGDINYVFEPQVHLPALDAPSGKGFVVVADEVHQLVERAREWYSPKLDRALAEAAIAALRAAGSDYDVFREMAERVLALVTELGEGRAAPGPVELPLQRLVTLSDEIEGVGLDYALLKADRQPEVSALEDPWLSLARAVFRFVEGAQDLDEERGDVVSLAGPERIQLVCLDPSRKLGPAISALGGFVGLSATLSPPEFYRDLLGLSPDRLDHLVLPSPFPPERRRILVASRVSTAFKDRDAHAEPTARLIRDCLREVPGNTALYFPSFAMLQDIVARVDLPERDWILQQPGMGDEARASLLARLSQPGPPRVLCAVLGGIFAEGIDLPPGALSAVFILGPALPPVGAERDLLRAYHESRHGQGFRYASLVPGLTRVIQAAGRLIRRPEDRGVILLVDRRFRWREVAELLPVEWQPQNALEPAVEIRAFFAALEGVQPAES